MIVMVCGLIGAGKTTWAKLQDEVISDYDDIKDKKKQIDFTLAESGLGNTVYHVTCYPTIEELDTFKDFEEKFVWINTTASQCRRNIAQRRRQRDMMYIDDVIKKNEELSKRYLTSELNFEVVDVFETNERW